MPLLPTHIHNCIFGFKEPTSNIPLITFNCQNIYPFANLLSSRQLTCHYYIQIQNLYHSIQICDSLYREQHISMQDPDVFISYSIYRLYSKKPVGLQVDSELNAEYPPIDQQYYDHLMVFLHAKKKTNHLASNTTCNDCCTLYDDKCLDYVSICLFIDCAIECANITSACL